MGKDDKMLKVTEDEVVMSADIAEKAKKEEIEKIVHIYTEIKERKNN